MQRIFLAIWYVASLLLLTGCLAVPVPVSKHLEGPRGRIDALDLTFLQSGTTSRSEVKEKLSSIDLGLTTPDLFWGHYYSSSAAMAGVTGTEPEAPVVGTLRIWHSHNLLIAFDAQGEIETRHDVADENVNKVLLEWLQTHPQPLHFPIRLSAIHRHERDKVGRGELLIDADRINFSENQIQKMELRLNKKTIYTDLPETNFDNFELKPSELRFVNGSFSEAKDGNSIYRVLEFDRPSQPKAGRSVWLETTPLTPDELLALLNYAKRYGHKVKFLGAK